MSEVMTKRRRKREKERPPVELSMKRAGGKRMVEYQMGKRRSPMAKVWLKGESRHETSCVLLIYILLAIYFVI